MQQQFTLFRVHLLTPWKTLTASRRGRGTLMNAQSSTLRHVETIILGSGSSSRKAIMDELAEQYGFSYSVITADIDEKALRHPDPRRLVLCLAHAKAAAIIEKMKVRSEELSGLLITCDQVVVHEKKILEKPEDEAEAREFIAGYARSPAHTIGSVVCTNLSNGKTYEEVDAATIHFSPIPQKSVDALIAEGDVYFCAGGLMVEHPLVAPHVNRMDGSLDGVMGLSKDLTMKLLMLAAESY